MPGSQWRGKNLADRWELLAQLQELFDTTGIGEEEEPYVPRGPGGRLLGQGLDTDAPLHPDIPGLTIADARNYRALEGTNLKEAEDYLADMIDRSIQARQDIETHGKEVGHFRRNVIDRALASVHRVSAQLPARSAVGATSRISFLESESAVDDLVSAYRRAAPTGQPGGADSGYFNRMLSDSGVRRRDVVALNRAIATEDSEREQEIRGRIREQLDARIEKDMERLGKNMQKYRTRMDRSEALPLPVDTMRLLMADDWGTAKDAFMNAPITASISMMMDSSSETGVILGAGFLGGMVGSLAGPGGSFAGAAAGSGAAGAMITYNTSFIQAAARRGVDVYDPEAFVEALRDGDLYKDIHEEATQLATVTGAVSALQISAATKFIGPLSTASMRSLSSGRATGLSARGTVVGEAENLLVQTAISATADAAEAAISGVLTDDFRPGQVAAAIAANVAGAGTSTPATVAVMRSPARLERQISEQLDDLMGPGQESTVPVLNERMEQSKQAIQDLLSDGPSLEDIDAVVRQYADVLESGDIRTGGVDTIATDLERQLSLLDSGLMQDDVVTMGDPTEQAEQALTPSQLRAEVEQMEATTPSGIAAEMEALSRRTEDAPLAADSLDDIASVIMDDFLGLDTRRAEGNINIPGRSGDLGIRLAPRDRVGTEVSDLVQVDPRVEELIFKLREGANTVEGLQDKLEAIHQAYEDGIIVDVTASLESVRNKRLNEARLRGDREAVRELLNDIIANPSSEEMIQNMTSREADVMSRVIGIDKEHAGAYDSATNQRGGVIGKALRAFDTATRRINRAFAGSGARGTSEKIMANIKALRENQVRVLMFRADEHMNRTADLLDASTITEDQKNAVNAYMSDPTRANAATIREQFGETGDRALSALRERRKLIDSLSAAMINNGVVSGKLADIVANDRNHYLRTMYAVHYADAPLSQSTPEARNKLVAMFAEKFNGPVRSIEDIRDLNTPQLKNLLHARGMLLYDEGGTARVLVDQQPVPIENFNKEQLVDYVAENAKPIPNEQLEAMVKDFIMSVANQDVSKLRDVRGHRVDDEGKVAREDRSSFNKRILANLDDDMSKAMREVLGEVTSPNERFIATVSSMIGTLAQHEALTDMFNFMLDNGLASTYPRRGMGDRIELPAGTSNAHFVLNIKDREGNTVPTAIDPFYRKGQNEQNILYMSRDTSDFIQQLYGIGKGEPSLGAKVWGVGNAAVKLAMTMFNLPAHYRNIVSAQMIALRNGLGVRSYMPQGALSEGLKIGAQDASVVEGLQWLDGIMEPVLGKAPDRVFLEDLIMYGVLHDGVRAGTLQDFYKDLVAEVAKTNQMDNMEAASQYMSGALKKLYNIHAVPFRLQDEIIKVASYIEERRKWANMLYSDDPSAIPLHEILKDNPDLSPNTISGELLNEYGVAPTTENMDLAVQNLNRISRVAAELSKAINPTYSKVSPMFRALRKNPFVGPFPAFAFEAYRSQYNALKYMGILWRAGDTGVLDVGNDSIELGPAGRHAAKGWAMDKMLGTVAEMAILNSLKLTMASFLSSTGVPDELFELDLFGAVNQLADTGNAYTSAVRAILPTWNEDMMFVVGGVDTAAGRATIFDLSRTIPHSPIYGATGVMYRAFQEHIHGNPQAWDEVAGRAIYQAVEPFVAEEPLMQEIMKLFDTDTPGVSSMDSGFAKLIAKSVPFASTWVPGYIKQVMESAITEEDIRNVLWQATGVRALTLDYNHLARAKVFAANGMHADLLENFLRDDSTIGRTPMQNKFAMFPKGVGDPNVEITDDELRDYYMTFRENEAKLLTQMRKGIDSLRVFGKTDPEIRDLMEQGDKRLPEHRAMNQNQIYEVIYNNGVPVRPLFDDRGQNTQLNKAINRWGVGQSTAPLDRQRNNEAVLRHRIRALQQLDQEYLTTRAWLLYGD